VGHLESVHQIHNSHIERVGDDVERLNDDVALAALDFAQLDEAHRLTYHLDKTGRLVLGLDPTRFAPNTASRSQPTRPMATGTLKGPGHALPTRASPDCDTDTAGRSW
jgi:hypothetical protein